MNATGPESGPEAARSPARFYVDESLLGIARALSYARQDVVHPGHPRFPAVILGDSDDVWVPAVASAGLIAIVRDRRVLSRWWEDDLVVSHRLRLIHLAAKRDLTNWGYLSLLAKHWDALERAMSATGEGPWRMAILESSVELRPIAARP
jgi:PIN like domain